MTFSSVIRTLARSPLTQELYSKLQAQKSLHLNGAPRLPKGLLASALAQVEEQNLLVVCATLEEAGRWTSQLEAMGWKQVFFYPTSESSPYEPFDPESEMIWGQMQVLSALGRQSGQSPVAIVATERSLQPHLPPPDVFAAYCLTLEVGMTEESQSLDRQLARLGYERVSLVETEGQWSRRGDLVDIFPVSAELPVRLEWFGDELEKMREFDPTTQRSLDKVDRLVLTPTSFSSLISAVLKEEEKTQESLRKFLGVAFENPASLLDYLPKNTAIAVDELEQCRAHSDRWLEGVEEQWEGLSKLGETLPKIHRSFDDSWPRTELFCKLYLSELAEENAEGFNLASRPIPVLPHQFAKLAEILRGKREIYSNMMLDRFSTWLISAQPSRSVALLQEHDCTARFVPNPQDYPAIEKLRDRYTPIALKYSGLAELEGFILPTFRIAVICDREFFGQHSLATPGYIRKRRRATSKKVDLDKLRPGDYVVHKRHGIGKFLKLEKLEMREYLAIKYADGLLRIPADSFDTLSRFRQTGGRPPQLNKLSGKAWESEKQSSQSR